MFCAVSADCMTYNCFKFSSCQPSTAAATVNSADDLAAGRIEVQLKQVVDTGREQKDWKPWHGSAPPSEGDKKLPDGKKWFMAPGLKVMRLYNFKTCNVVSFSVPSSAAFMVELSQAATQASLSSTQAIVSHGHALTHCK